MNKKVDRALWEMFCKTGDPFYYTARGVLREKDRRESEKEWARH